MIVKIHSLIEKTKSNGPGTRFGVWFQGCSILCDGCYNPKTHSSINGNIYLVEDLSNYITSVENIEGVTISGGEPFDQPTALFELVKSIKNNSSLGIIVYSGYTIEQIENNVKKNPVLRYIDVLIDGKYIENKVETKYYKGSSNQRLHFISNILSSKDFKSSNPVEVIITKENEIITSGFPTI